MDLSRGPVPIVRSHALMDPNRTLDEVFIEDLDSIEIIDDEGSPAETEGPFYVVVIYVDTTPLEEERKEFIEDFETMFGPYTCIQEANDAAMLLALDHYRDLYTQYYGTVNTEPSIRMLGGDGKGDGFLSVDPIDPGRKFWLCASVTNDRPTSDIQDPSNIHQGWDVFVVTCILSGATRKGCLEPSNPSVKTKVSVSRHNANKYAAALFFQTTKFLLSTQESDEYIGGIKAVYKEAERAMKKAAKSSYSWTYTKTFISRIQKNSKIGNQETFIKISVHRHETEP